MFTGVCWDEVGSWSEFPRRVSLQGVPARPRATRPLSREWLVKKGRHRRFEEARSLKRAVEVVAEPCPECGAGPEEDHATWCLYEPEELEGKAEDLT